MLPEVILNSARIHSYAKRFQPRFFLATLVVLNVLILIIWLVAISLRCLCYFRIQFCNNACIPRPKNENPKLADTFSLVVSSFCFVCKIAKRFFDLSNQRVKVSLHFGKIFYKVSVAVGNRITARDAYRHRARW